MYSKILPPTCISRPQSTFYHLIFAYLMRSTWRCTHNRSVLLSCRFTALWMEQAACCVCGNPARDRRRRVLLSGTSVTANTARTNIEAFYREETGQDVSLDDLFSAGSYICSSCSGYLEEYPKLKKKWEQVQQFLSDHLPSASTMGLDTPTRRSRPPFPTPLAMSTPKRLRAEAAVHKSPQVQVRDLHFYLYVGIHIRTNAVLLTILLNPHAYN